MSDLCGLIVVALAEVDAVVGWLGRGKLSVNLGSAFAREDYHISSNLSIDLLTLGCFSFRKM